MIDHVAADALVDAQELPPDPRVRRTTALLFAALLVVLIRRLPASYSLYAAATLLLGLSAQNLDSFERYCMSTFPFLLALAVVTDGDEVERGALVLAGAGLVGYAILAFLGVSGP